MTEKESTKKCINGQWFEWGNAKWNCRM